MIRRFRDGYFAVGLIAGIAVTLLLCLSYEALKGDAQSDQQILSVATQGNDNAPVVERSFLLEWFLSDKGDTLAQWVMALFTMLATVLLFWTLRVTRQMEYAATRAYVHMDEAEIQLINGLGQFDNTTRSEVFGVLLTILNTGQTPSKWHEISGVVQVQQRAEGGNTTIHEIPIETKRWGAIHGGAKSTSQLKADGLLPLFHEATEDLQRIFKISGDVTYKTEFNEIRSVPFAFFANSDQIGAYFTLRDLGQYEEAKSLKTRMYRPPAKLSD